MNGGSIEQELARIDAAIARVETTARAPSVNEPSDTLLARHEALKAVVSHTIDQIDSLIAEDDLITGDNPIEDGGA